MGVERRKAELIDLGLEIERDGVFTNVVGARVTLILKGVGGEDEAA